jgi:lysophospholipase L1-like esterase
MKLPARRTRLLLWLPMAGLLGGLPLHAAEPVGMVDEPCPPPLEQPAALRTLLGELFIEPRTLSAADFERLARNPDLAAINAENRKRAAQDWAGVCRYHAANVAALRAREAPRVVFMGDSITENWVMGDPGFFEHGILGRGIGGQTSPQMLVRFRADVVALHPKIVHILAGTNDVAGNTGPTSPQDFENDIMSMVEIAQANGIRVILGSIPPAAGFSWRPELKPVAQIAELNAWLRDYAGRANVEFIDYYSALVGSAGELKRELSNDGVHPNRDGYAIMRRLVEPKLAPARER